MRVMCIDNKFHPELANNGLHQISEGEVYEVERVKTFESGRQGYKLIGISDWHYYIGRFLPLSEKDETELVNQKTETA